jgi:hypothetical protein
MHVAVIEGGRDGFAVYSDTLRVGVARGEVVFRARRHDAPLAHNHRLRQRQFVPKSVYRRAIDEVHGSRNSFLLAEFLLIRSPPFCFTS